MKERRFFDCKLVALNYEIMDQSCKLSTIGNEIKTNTVVPTDGLSEVINMAKLFSNFDYLS